MDKTNYGRPGATATSDSARRAAYIDGLELVWRALVERYVLAAADGEAAPGDIERINRIEAQLATAMPQAFAE